MTEVLAITTARAVPAAEERKTSDGQSVEITVSETGRLIESSLPCFAPSDTGKFMCWNGELRTINFITEDMIGIDTPFPTTPTSLQIVTPVTFLSLNVASTSAFDIALPDKSPQTIPANTSFPIPGLTGAIALNPTGTVVVTYQT